MATKNDAMDSNMQSASQTMCRDNRRRVGTVEVPGTNSLGSLEQSSHASSSPSTTATMTTISAASLGPWPEGYSNSPPPPASPARDATLHSALAFLERRTRASTSAETPAIMRGTGADAGFGNLSGGMIAGGSGQDGFLSHWGDDSDPAGILDEDDDDNVCPSMLFSCLPCLVCLRCVSECHSVDRVGQRTKPREVINITDLCFARLSRCNAPCACVLFCTLYLATDSIV